MVDRLFQIVYTLMNQETVTCNELAERFECSTRTIMRDIDKLSMAGVPVYTNKGRNGGISLLPDYVLDRTVLTEEEKRQVLSSLQAIKETGYGEEKETLDKLRSLFGGDNQDWIEIEFSKWGEPGKVEAYFKQIKDAIMAHHILELTYAANSKRCSTRKVKPLKLCFRGYAWYLYGYCTLREDYRFFKLSRIIELVDTKEPFVPLKVGRVLSEPVESKRKEIPIKLQVYEKQLYRVLEELPQGEFQKDGSIIVEFSSNDESGIISYILSMGKDVKVLEPAWMRETVKAKIQEMNHIYD